MIQTRTRVIVGALLLAVSIVLGVLVTHVGAPAFDAQLVRHARGWRDGFIGDVMDLASEVGYAVWLVPITIVASLVLAIAMRRRRDATIVALSTAMAAIVSRILKETFDRVRPTGAHELVAGFSMPSGHAASSSAFAMSIVFAAHGTRVARPVTVLVVAFAIVVGVSRVVLGVHFPTDIVAGYCSGTGVALLVAAAVDSVHVGRPGGVTGDEA
ncbi:MAG: putative transrane acid phosphatase [Thermoleophilia bacterium]|nr:putative transrane acid phosphatase [Thermoleophilia bacterium]